MREKKRILVIDDEPDICDILVFNLETEGFRADMAGSAEEAMERHLGDYDLLILDVMMPGLSGFQFARQLKASDETRHLPIIFITAKGEEKDLLEGFGIGADDYVVKPFSIKEVMARVKAVILRTQHGSSSATICFEGMKMDAQSKKVWIDGKEIALTRTEFGLLWLLLEHQGNVFSRQQLLEHVWPKEVIVSDRTVDVNIARMRKKIGPYAACVVARPGFGYSFVKNEALD